MTSFKDFILDLQTGDLDFWMKEDTEPRCEPGSDDAPLILPDQAKPIEYAFIDEHTEPAF